MEGEAPVLQGADGEKELSVLSTCLIFH